MPPKVSTHRNTVPEKQRVSMMVWTMQTSEPGQLESTKSISHLLAYMTGTSAQKDKSISLALIFMIHKLFFWREHGSDSSDVS